MNRTRQVRLTVDWTTCDGHGLCAELVPELLGRDPWGYPEVAGGGGTVDVPPRLAVHARRAVAACPRLALHVDNA